MKTAQGRFCWSKLHHWKQRETGISFLPKSLCSANHLPTEYLTRAYKITFLSENFNWYPGDISVFCRYMFRNLREYFIAQGFLDCCFSSEEVFGVFGCLCFFFQIKQLRGKWRFLPISSVIPEWSLLPPSLWTVTINWILLPSQLCRALMKLSHLMYKILEKMSSTQERNRMSGKNIQVLNNWRLLRSWRKYSYEK